MVYSLSGLMGPLTRPLPHGGDMVSTGLVVWMRVASRDPNFSLNVGTLIAGKQELALAA